MPRLPKPYILLRRKDAKTFQIILNTTSGLSAKVCRKWQRVSFQNFPDTLAQGSQALRVAVKDLSDREDLGFDPFRRVRPAQETPREKGVLTAEEVSRLIHAPVKGPAGRLAVLLGVLCGMRRGSQVRNRRNPHVYPCRIRQDGINLQPHMEHRCRRISA
jgi:integrase